MKQIINVQSAHKSGKKAQAIFSLPGKPATTKHLKMIEEAWSYKHCGITHYLYQGSLAFRVIQEQVNAIVESKLPTKNGAKKKN